MLYIWFVFVLVLYICFFTIDFDMFQIELVSIILPWIEIFIKIWFCQITLLQSLFLPKKEV